MSEHCLSGASERRLNKSSGHKSEFASLISSFRASKWGRLFLCSAYKLTRFASAQRFVLHLWFVSFLFASNKKKRNEHNRPSLEGQKRRRNCSLTRRIKARSRSPTPTPSPKERGKIYKVPVIDFILYSNNIIYVNIKAAWRRKGFQRLFARSC